MFFIWLLFDAILEPFSGLVLGKSGDAHEGWAACAHPWLWSSGRQGSLSCGVYYTLRKNCGLAKSIFYSSNVYWSCILTLDIFLYVEFNNFMYESLKMPFYSLYKFILLKYVRSEYSGTYTA